MSVLAVIKDPKLFFKYIRRQSNLARFLNLTKDEVTEYLRESEQITRTMLRLAENAKLGAMFSPLRGPIVYTCIRALKPAIMVETGVASGSSTAYILKAMELNKSGLLYSIDLPNADPGALVPENKETGWIVPSELRHRWKLILGRSQEQLPPLLRELQKIDAFLHDSEHTYEVMMFEYETVWPHLRDRGVLLSDDIHWNGAFYDFARNKHSTRCTTFDGLGAIMAVK
jgi:predicted O-methyltransferase YrrM